jgi:hypothetical protein
LGLPGGVWTCIIAPALELSVSLGVDCDAYMIEPCSGGMHQNALLCVTMTVSLACSPLLSWARQDNAHHVLLLVCEQGLELALSFLVPMQLQHASLGSHRLCSCSVGQFKSM